jgi:hypothetical protein
MYKPRSIVPIVLFARDLFVSDPLQALKAVNHQGDPSNIVADY